MLRRISFVLLLLGLIFLFVFFNKSPMGVDSLDGIEINEKVFIKGRVESLRDFGDFKIFSVKGIDFVCECGAEILKGIKGEVIEIIGVVEEYEGRKQVRVLEILEI